MIKLSSEKHEGQDVFILFKSITQTVGIIIEGDG